MMDVANSVFFTIASNSWLGMRLDDGRLKVANLQEALLLECRGNKGEKISARLNEMLKNEKGQIENLPSDVKSLRMDCIAKKYRRASGAIPPSVDVCLRLQNALLLVECKYKAMPETKIIVDFERQVIRKFDASKSFLQEQGTMRFCDDRPVLFNADSKEKVKSMFLRRQRERDDDAWKSYRVMDTCEFWSEYGNHVFA